MKTKIRKNRLIVQIPRSGKFELLTGRGATTNEAMKEWVVGWMGGARKHPSLYRNLGIKKIVFRYGRKRTIRRI